MKSILHDSAWLLLYNYFLVHKFKEKKDKYKSHRIFVIMIIKKKRTLAGERRVIYDNTSTGKRIEKKRQPTK